MLVTVWVPSSTFLRLIVDQRGTAEQYVQEIVKVGKAILSDTYRPMSHWVPVIPVVQWALS